MVMSFEATGALARSITSGVLAGGMVGYEDRVVRVWVTFFWIWVEEMMFMDVISWVVARSLGIEGSSAGLMVVGKLELLTLGDASASSGCGS